MTICFFLVSGKTFTFKNASIIHDNETVWMIEYVAMSDGHSKRATFFKQNVVGIAVSDPTAKA